MQNLHLDLVTIPVKLYYYYLRTTTVYYQTGYRLFGNPPWEKNPGLSPNKPPSSVHLRGLVSVHPSVTLPRTISSQVAGGNTRLSDRQDGQP